MIAFIQGKVFKKSAKSLILLNQGIGYYIFLKESELEKIVLGEEIEFFIHQYIREDANVLYGFRTFPELEMFELLLSISGIGPKAGLGILNLADVSQIRKSILLGDSSLLTRVSGVGKKIAERVVLELKNKIGNLTAEEQQQPSFSEINAQMDAIDALVALGYSQTQARETLSTLDVSLSTEEKIKQALKQLGRS